MSFLKGTKKRSFLKVLAFLALSVCSYFLVSSASAHAYGDQEPAYEQRSPGSDVPEEEVEGLESRLEQIITESDENGFLRIVIIFFSYLFFLALIAGLVLDGRFLWLFRKGEVPRIRTVPHMKPGWGLLDIMFFMVVFYIASMLFAEIMSFFQVRFPIAENENFQLFTISIWMNFLAVAFIIFLVKFMHSQDLQVLGLTRRNFLKNIGYAIIAYIAFIPVLVAINYATHYVTQLIGYDAPTQDVVKMFMAEKEMPILLLGFFAASIVAPVAEEIIFRGFAYSALKKTMGVFWSIVLTSLIFSVLHAHVVGIVPIFALGVLLAYLYERTGSLIAPITVHMIHNTIMLVLVFVLRGV